MSQSTENSMIKEAVNALQFQMANRFGKVAPVIHVQRESDNVLTLKMSATFTLDIPISEECLRDVEPDALSPMLESKWVQGIRNATREVEHRYGTSNPFVLIARELIEYGPHHVMLPSTIRKATAMLRVEDERIKEIDHVDNG